ncbi:MAG TPA: PEGA domain-containing protein [Polyangiaceae bacterium]|nr:PEGA domain-containing protein [Polyangiaceae bacterium]
MKRIGVGLLFLQVCLSAPPALAESGQSSSSQVDQARGHFERGAALFKEGSFDAALAEFKRAYEIVPNYKVLYNIGQAQIERHDYVAALRAFEDYLRQGAADIPSERRESVEREITSLKTRVASLVVRSNVRGAELFVDGVSVGTLPLDSDPLVSAGTRRLTLKKTGYTQLERTVSVAGGDHPEIEMNLEPLPTTTGADAQPSGPVTPIAMPASRPIRPATWVSLAATCVFTGAAVTFGILAQKSNDDLDTAMRYPADPNRVDDVRSRLKLQAALTDGFGAAAAASAILTVYFALSGSHSSETARAHRAPIARVVPTGQGVAVFGKF